MSDDFLRFVFKKAGFMSVRKLLMIFGVLTAFSGCTLAERLSSKPLAQNGVIDLRDWDFERQGVVELAGEWLFFWDRLLVQSDFENQATPPKPTGVIPFPGLWNGYRVDGQPLSGHGYATYRLKLLLPPGNSLYAFKFFDMATAFRFWAGDQLLSKNGDVGTDATSSRPQFLPGLVHFENEAETVILTLQISNFHHKKGGAWMPIYFGTEDSVRAKREMNLGFEYLLLGCMLAMSFYHLGLFLMRRSEKSLLFFSLVCLLVSVRVTLVGERLLIHHFQEFDWVWHQRLEYLTFYLSIALFFQFLSTLYKEFPKRLTTIVTVISILFSSIVLITHPRVFTHTLLYYHAFFLGAGLIGIGIIFRLTIKRREETVFFATGTALLLITVFVDMLAADDIITAVNIVPLGILAFVFFHAILLSNRFFYAYSELETVSANLKQTNLEKDSLLIELKTFQLELEKKVEQRTKELKVAKMKAEAANEAKSEFLANVSHELRNPMHHILSYSSLGSNKIGTATQEKLKHYFKQVHKSGSRLMVLLNDLLDLSKLEAGKTEFNFISIDPVGLIEDVINDYRAVCQEKGIDLRLNKSFSNLKLTCDPFKIGQVMRNLLSNAFRYSTENTEIVVTLQHSVDKRGDPGYLHISVSDQGVGLPEGELGKIFEKFTQSSFTKTGAGGTGLGLAISYEIIIAHRGRIWANNNSDRGATFHVELPLDEGSEEDLFI